jgi:hypothetical protein
MSFANLSMASLSRAFGILGRLVLRGHEAAAHDEEGE